MDKPEKPEKLFRVGARTTHGRPFWRFGSAIQPKGTTYLELTADQVKSLEAEVAAAEKKGGGVIEIVEKAKPIEKPATKPEQPPKA